MIAFLVTQILQSNYYEKERCLQKRDGIYGGVATVVNINPRKAPRF